MKIAVIGSGISGLGAAYFLSPEHEVWVFEKDERIGGHTHTVAVSTPEGAVPVDTGFIVHNRENYPNLVALLEKLGVPTCPSDMSFAYQGPEFDWCSRGLDGLFSDRANLVNPRYWAFWKEILRFNPLGRAFLENPNQDTTLAKFLDQHRFSRNFRQAYLLPMAGSVWSMTLNEMEDFPALALLQFFHNHGMLGVTTQRPWRTIPGGTSRYLEPITRPFRERIQTGVEVRVRRTKQGATVQVLGEEPQAFDQIIFASRAPQVLQSLEDATPLEKEILGAFSSSVNPTWLHEDISILPKHRRGWASWNYRKRPEAPDQLLLSYHMNRLQPLPNDRDFLVTLNPEGQVDEAKVHRKLVYEHPRFTLEALRAQRRWEEISGSNRLHFCGAYWRCGFHEDGLWSGIRVARALGAPC
jgi:predicted NAD/FAD-binding protein